MPNLFHTEECIFLLLFFLEVSLSMISHFVDLMISFNMANKDLWHLSTPKELGARHGSIHLLLEPKWLWQHSLAISLVSRFFLLMMKVVKLHMTSLWFRPYVGSCNNTVFSWYDTYHDTVITIIYNLDTCTYIISYFLIFCSVLSTVCEK